MNTLSKDIIRISSSVVISVTILLLAYSAMYLIVVTIQTVFGNSFASPIGILAFESGFLIFSILFIPVVLFVCAYFVYKFMPALNPFSFLITGIITAFIVFRKIEYFQFFLLPSFIKLLIELLLIPVFYRIYKATLPAAA